MLASIRVPFQDAGLGGKAMRDGVKLLGGGSEAVSMPLHFEVGAPTPSDQG